MARWPSAPACGLRPGSSSMGRAAPDGTGLGRGAAGPRVRPCGDRGLHGVRTPWRQPWQLPGVREAASCSPWRWGCGHRFPRPRRAELSARAPGGRTGVPQALPNPPCSLHDEWTGGARPGRKRTPPARSAKRAGTRPGARPGLPGCSLGQGRAGRGPRFHWGFREVSGTSPHITDHKR